VSERVVATAFGFAQQPLPFCGKRQNATPRVVRAPRPPHEAPFDEVVDHGRDIRRLHHETHAQFPKGRSSLGNERQQPVLIFGEPGRVEDDLDDLGEPYDNRRT
jgi:hypothetical protein